MDWITILGAASIGLSLGLTGAGGSVITLPVLVYLAGLEPGEAVGVSLFVVGSAALAGAVQRSLRGEIHLRAALFFSIAGSAGAALGSQFTSLVSPAALLMIFAILMIGIAAVMLLGRGGEPAMLPECKPLRCLSAGFGVGLLTGFIGVGGGFLLMPAMIKFARLPLPVATGTSLAVIAVNSAAGFLSHYQKSDPRWPLALFFAGVAVAGVIVGSAAASRLPAARLRQLFALVVLGTGLFVLIRGPR